MTIETTLRKKIYYGNGLTRVWSIPFALREASHLRLILREQNINHEITSNFSVNLEAQSVTYPLTGKALPSGAELTLYRTVPLTQIVDLENAGAFHPEVLEKDGFDRLVMQIQQVEEHVSRAICVDINDEKSPESLRDAIFQAEKNATTQAGIATTKANEAENSATASANSASSSQESASQASTIKGEVETLYSDAVEELTGIKNQAVADTTAIKTATQKIYDDAVMDTTAIKNEAISETEALGQYWATAEIDENNQGSAKYWALQASQGVPDASETVAGKIGIATTEEALAGQVGNKAVTPKDLPTVISALTLSSLQSQTFTTSGEWTSPVDGIVFIHLIHGGGGGGKGSSSVTSSGFRGGNGGGLAAGITGGKYQDGWQQHVSNGPYIQYDISHGGDGGYGGRLIASLEVIKNNTYSIVIGAGGIAGGSNNSIHGGVSNFNSGNYTILSTISRIDSYPRRNIGDNTNAGDGGYGGENSGFGGVTAPTAGTAGAVTIYWFE